jgi:hypothetical protein
LETVEAALVGEPCAGARVPRRVARLLAAARRLVAQAAHARRPARARASLARALGRLRAGERALAHAHVGADCAASLADRFARARGAATCVMDSL